VDGVIGTVVMGIVVVSIVAAGLTYGRRKSRAPEPESQAALKPDPAPRLPESEPAMRGATVAAVAPTAAGAFRAVSAPAEPSTTAQKAEAARSEAAKAAATGAMAENVEQPSTPAKERRRLSNNGARRFGQSGNNVRTIRSIQTR
jgi:hypothetical protein